MENTGKLWKNTTQKRLNKGIVSKVSGQKHLITRSSLSNQRFISLAVKQIKSVFNSNKILGDTMNVNK